MNLVVQSADMYCILRFSTVITRMRTSQLNFLDKQPENPCKPNYLFCGNHYTAIYCMLRWYHVVGKFYIFRPCSNGWLIPRFFLAVFDYIEPMVIFNTWEKYILQYFSVSWVWRNFCPAKIFICTVITIELIIAMQQLPCCVQIVQESHHLCFP